MKKVFFLIMLVAAALIGFLIFRSVFVSTPYTKMLPKLSDASTAQVPNFFPKQFILGRAPEVVKAETLDASATSTRISLSFRDYENTVQTLYDEYRDYAPRAYWTVEESQTSAELATLKLSRGIQRVSITIKSAPSGGITADIEYNVSVK